MAVAMVVLHDRLAKVGLHASASTTSAPRPRGGGPRVIMETLGHGQISLTMDTYSHVPLDGQRDAAARMDDIPRRLTGHDRPPGTGQANYSLGSDQPA
jgi:hypothetical protein